MTTTIDMFEDRKDYDEFDGTVIAISNFDDFRFPEPIDFWYDKAYYGRVNQQNDVVFISQETFGEQEKLKMVSEKGVYALEFVANAFNDFRKRIDTNIAFGGEFSTPTISKTSVIKNIAPKKGFLSVDSLYEEYLKSYFNIFMGSYLHLTFRDEQVENVEDFFKFFIEFSLSVARDMPFTKTGFIKSQYCSPLVSGLIIEISFFDHDDDEMKGKYIDDLNFGYYQDLAKRYGFYVDKNAPWRLVANVSSPQMQRYWIRGTLDPTLAPIEPKPGEVEGVIENCKPILDAETAVEVEAAVLELPGTMPVKFLQPTSVQDLFDTYYNKSYMQDMFLMGEKLVEYYNEYVSTFPQVIVEKKESCAHKLWAAAGRPTAGYTLLSKKIITRHMVTDEELQNYSIVTLFDHYLNLRAKEENISFSKARSNQIIKNAKRIYLYIDKMDLDKGETMRYINNEIKGFSPKQAKAAEFSLSEEGQIAPGGGMY